MVVEVIDAAFGLATGEGDGDGDEIKVSGKIEGIGEGTKLGDTVILLIFGSPVDFNLIIK